MTQHQMVRIIMHRERIMA